jgi:hypothetical protein
MKRKKDPTTIQDELKLRREIRQRKRDGAISKDWVEDSKGVPRPRIKRKK